MGKRYQHFSGMSPADNQRPGPPLAHKAPPPPSKPVDRYPGRSALAVASPITVTVVGVRHDGPAHPSPLGIAHALGLPTGFAPLGREHPSRIATEFGY